MTNIFQGALKTNGVCVYNRFFMVLLQALL